MPRSENALVFMAKWPEAGRAKTRLCPPYTPVQAADLARAFLLDTLAEAALADADRWIAFAPASDAPRFRALFGDAVGLIHAEGEHFGVALATAQAEALALGYRRVALVGSDLPHIRADRYTAAFAALADADVSIAPSADGGYSIIAAARPTPALFGAMAWSTAVVYAQTRTWAAAAGLRVAELPPCDDADTAADLPPLLATLRQHPGAGHTLARLEALLGVDAAAGRG